MSKVKRSCQLQVGSQKYLFHELNRAISWYLLSRTRSRSDLQFSKQLGNKELICLHYFSLFPSCDTVQKIWNISPLRMIHNLFTKNIEIFYYARIRIILLELDIPVENDTRPPQDFPPHCTWNVFRDGAYLFQRKKSWLSNFDTVNFQELPSTKSLDRDKERLLSKLCTSRKLWQVRRLNS